MTDNSVYIVSCARTPVGSFRGALSTLSAVDLGAIAIKESIKRAGIKEEDVSDVFMGHVISAGCGQNTARQAALKAGLPVSTCCTTVNKVCASGMQSIILATQSIKLGEADVIVAGGMESMSNAPYLMDRCPPAFGGFQHLDAIQKDGLTDADSGRLMGECTEDVAAEMNITREDQDNYAIQSYKRSAAAWNKEKGESILAKEVVEVKIVERNGEKIVKEDEEYSKVNFEKLKTLRTVFKKVNGTITAGNASTLSDGGAACVLMSAKEVEKRKIKPLAKIVTYTEAADTPYKFSIVPALAISKALTKTGLKTEDISLFEINEAFSVAGLGNIRLCNLPNDKVNVFGGAVSLGHPLGMSGTRIVNSLAMQLKPGEYGCASLCVGGGQASCMIIQKC